MGKHLWGRRDFPWVVAGPLLPFSTASSREKKIDWDMGHNGPISQVLSSDLSQPNASLLVEHKLCCDVVSLVRWALSFAPCFSKSS